jgi:nucleoside-diphosphate-sugar epimerase
MGSSIDQAFRQRVSFAIVDDIVKEGAFDEVACKHLQEVLVTDTNQVVMSSPPFDYVVHTASPYQMSWEDPQKECLDPAIKGISGLLESLYRHAPAVKRVVFTSSSAAILNPPKHPKVYDESSWCKITWEEAMDPVHTYRASKVRPSLLRAKTPHKSFTAEAH